MDIQLSTRICLLAGLLGFGVLPACSDDDDDGDATADGSDGAADGSDGAADGSDGEDGSEDGSDGADGDDEGSLNIVETAVAAGGFDTLAAALVRTGLDEVLSGAGPFTVFAPTDEAFAALPEGTLDALTDEQLATILTYHVVAGEVTSDALTAGPVTTVSTFSAFVNLSGGVKINDANVTTADIDATNGVIHVIDKVILPPNLAQAATFAGAFSTLLGAVETAGLTATLADPESDLTVFAPTDDAFAALPEGTLESLTEEQLTDILTYHVVAGSVLSTDLTSGDVETLNGGDLAVVVGASGVTVNGINVIIADVVTTNGVIHVIDGVLLPE